MRVVIAGAGIGGLMAAKAISDLGHSVTVFERAASIDKMRYDWHDDVSPKIFKRLGIEMPKEHFDKRSWTFVSPFEKVIRPFEQDETEPDVSMERRPLNSALYDLSKDKVNFVFGASVESAVVENGRVVGARVGGKIEGCDLLVDSAGVFSPVRRSLPAEFGISEVKKDEVFEAYRAFFKRNPDSEDPKYTNKVYMKHLGEAGISWCLLDKDPNIINVLVGRIASLSDESLDKALDDLRKNNPIIGTEVLRGGFKTFIPVRYPATKMVADGYVAIGDCAYMTIPMLGSGIASSMLAGHILGEVLAENAKKGVADVKLATKENLWAYQVRCYEEFGSEHCGVDYMKRWMLTMTNDVADWLFGSKLLSNEDLGAAAGGGSIKITVKSAIQKVKAAGFKHLPTLLEIASVVGKSDKMKKLALEIPQEYDEKKIAKWQQKLEKNYN